VAAEPKFQNSIFRLVKCKTLHRFHFAARNIALIAQSR
jgi:hypothetical protein